MCQGAVGGEARGEAPEEDQGQVQREAPEDDQGEVQREAHGEAQGEAHGESQGALSLCARGLALKHIGHRSAGTQSVSLTYTYTGYITCNVPNVKT